MVISIIYRKITKENSLQNLTLDEHKQSFPVHEGSVEIIPSSWV